MRGSVLDLRPTGLEFHHIHLTILRRFSWPSLAYIYMCIKPHLFHLISTRTEPHLNMPSLTGTHLSWWVRHPGSDDVSTGVDDVISVWRGKSDPHSDDGSLGSSPEPLASKSSPRTKWRRPQRHVRWRHLACFCEPVTFDPVWPLTQLMSVMEWRALLSIPINPLKAVFSKHAV